MSSYGIEVEIWRPVYFEISSIKIQDRLTKEFIPVEFNRPPIKIGPERMAENAALYDILTLVLRELEKGQKVFEKLREAVSNPQNFGTLRLNRSPIRLDSVESAATIFNFPALSAEEMIFVLQNIIFSIDHDSEAQMILELVTNPIGRYRYHDRRVFREQENFLLCFFKFCHALANSEREYRFPCSIDWHDPRSWHMTDIQGTVWNYNIIFYGTVTVCKLLPVAMQFGARSQLVPINRFPQYNFSVDLSHFTLAKALSTENDLRIVMPNKIRFLDEIKWEIDSIQIELSRQDPFLYLYSLCAVDSDLIAYNLFLTEFSRTCVHRMDQLVKISDARDFDNIHKTTILGAFGYTIWYFLSLCVGGCEGNKLHKNLFLFMPKTSPIPFLKAAYHAEPNYYQRLMLNMNRAFFDILLFYLQHSSRFSRKFAHFLKMDYLFPRLARWYRAGQDKIELATPSSDLDATLRYYSNPLSSDLSSTVQEFHNVILILGKPYCNTDLDPFLYGDIKHKFVLSVLCKFLNLIFIGASDECRQTILLKGEDVHKKSLEIVGKILTAQDANQIPVYAQPGFGRPKIEARAIRRMPTDPQQITDLVFALNSIGRPALSMSQGFQQIAQLPQNIDQESVDLTISNMGDGNQFNPIDNPWESDEYKYVWLPGKTEFGRRKEEDIRRWLESLDSSVSSNPSTYTFEPRQSQNEVKLPERASDFSKIDIGQILKLLEISDHSLNSIVSELF